jgi:D-alanyl-lipoteichoic acid acyltransferase DltB (MBOAT superfamily)
MFFPQLVAGPLARASHLLHQFATPKRLRFENVVDGLWLIIRGYFFKMVIADRLSPLVDAEFDSVGQGNSILAVQAIYFFAFQIYFDFCGYTNIAQGLARLFDFELAVNFNQPYTATSITDFWRRWHISLSTWLRDYLYVSLGGNRHGKWKTYRNLLLTMVLGGLWHGANLTFVIWGTIHGVLLSLEKAAKNIHWAFEIPTWAKRVLTFHLVCLAWIFFRCKSVDQAFRILSDLGAIFTKGLEGNWRHICLFLWFFVFLGLFWEWAEARLQLYARYKRMGVVSQSFYWWVSFILFFLFAEFNPTAFIYFQF